MVRYPPRTEFISNVGFRFENTRRGVKTNEISAKIGQAPHNNLSLNVLYEP